MLTRGRMLDHLRATGEQARPSRSTRPWRGSVGRRAGVQALLLASVRKLGDTYAVELRAVDPERDEYLFTRAGADGRARTASCALIDRLSERTRLALRETSGEVAASDVKVGEAITDSLEAYQHYFLSQQAFEDHDFERSLAEAKQALEIDPDMALAHAWIAWLAGFGVAGRRGHGAAHPGGHGARRRAAGQGAALRRGARPRAPRATRRRQRRVPAARRRLPAGEALRASSPAWRRPPPPVKRNILDRALAIDPTFVWAVYLLADAAEEMLPLARRAVELRPDFRPQFNLALALGARAGRRRRSRRPGGPRPWPGRPGPRSTRWWRRRWPPWGGSGGGGSSSSRGFARA